MKRNVWLKTEAEIVILMTTTGIPYPRVQISRVCMPRLLTYLPTVSRLASRFRVDLVVSVILRPTSFVAEDVLDLS